MLSTAAPLARRPLLRCCAQAAAQATTTTAARTAMLAASSRAGAARRLITTEAASKTPASLPAGFHTIPTKDGRVRTAFAVYSPPKSATEAAATSAASPSQAQPTPAPSPAAASSAPATTTTAAATTPSKPTKVDVLRAYDQQQIARMDPTGARTALFSRKNPDSAKPGDILLVTSSKAAGDSFAGVCIAIRRRGIETAVLLRGQLARTGVEMWFKIYSRAVAAIDIIQRSPRRARRAKLTYMRSPKHDRGSVEDLVRAWRRSRNVVRSRGRLASAKKPGKK